MKILQVLTLELFFLILIFTVRVDASPQCDINITWSSNTTYTISQNNTYYCLNQSWYIAGVTAINTPTNLQNSTLDCLGYNLDSNDTLGTDGIYLTGSNIKNNTIKNCNITDFDLGIYLSNGPNFNTISNNTAYSNNNYGIYLYSSSNNTLSNTTLNNNNNYGILIDLSSNNTISNNTAYSNKNYGIALSSSSNFSTISNNTAYNNSCGIYLGSSSNFNTISNNTAYNNSHGIYLQSSSNFNTISNNTAYNNSYGIFLSSSSNNTLSNTTLNNNTDTGIYIYSSSNNTLSNTTLNNNNNGIILDSSSNNTITGGSIADNSNDYYLILAGTTNNFTNTNFTTSRKISFDDTTSWFNYRNDTGNIWLKTNVSTTATITRKLINWNQTLMQWNDTNSSGSNIVANYNITGLNANKYYNVYNNSVLAYTLQTNSSGNLPSFTIYLSSQHEIKVEEDTQAPQYFNITVSPASGTTYSASQIYTFQSTWTDNVAVSDVILEFAGANHSYLAGQLSKSGNTYSTSFTGLSVGTYNYRWFSNDTSNNWNSTSTYTYQIVIQSTTPPTTTAPTTVNLPPPENPTEFPPTVIELPDLPPPGTPITLPSKGLTVKLEKNFVITLYPLTNTTAIVHNLSKIEEPSKYKILLCNQSLVSSYEINITVDLAYYCANYSGYPIEEPTINIFKFKQNEWIPLITGNIVRNATKKIICGKIEATPYMITGFQPSPTSETAMLAIKDVNNSIDVAKRQNLNVTEADQLLNQALYEYYSCNYITAKALADQALNSLVKVKIPKWLVYLAFVLIIIIGICYYKLVRGLKHQI